MFTRAGRAALFDRRAFADAYFDHDAAADAAIVVATVGALTYLGWWLRGAGSISFSGLFGVLIASVTSWLILGFATWFAASRLFGSQSRPQTMIALQGLAALPLLLEVADDEFGGLIAGVGLVWYLAVLVVGTKEAADIQTKHAAVSVLIGFAAAVLIRALLRVPFAVFGSIF